jgi:lysophospholipase L1-like esterase
VTRYADLAPTFDAPHVFRDGLGVLGPGSAAYEALALRSWRAAWANRKAAPVNVLLLGDSNTVGFYANDDPGRWAKVLSATLQAANGQRPDVGYMPRHSLTNYILPWTSSGTVTEFTNSGLGYGTVGLAAGTGYIETTQTCDRFWVRYTAGTLIGQFTVKIDGNTPVTVPNIAGTIAGGYTWDSGPLTRGSHTIRITSTDGSFANRFEGLVIFDGNGNTSGSQGTLSAANSLTGTGVRVWNGAKFGTRAGHFAVSGGLAWWTDGLDKINPDLVILAFGTNEVSQGTTTTQFKADIAAIVTQVNTVMTAASRPAPSYLFVVPHGTGANDAAFLPYRTAIIEAAFAAGAALVDRHALTGFIGTAGADQWGLSTVLDGATRVHLSNRAHRLAGEHLADYLLRSAGTRMAGVDDTGAVPIHQIPIGTSSSTVAQGDLPLLKASNLSDLASASTARTNLGLATPWVFKVTDYGAVGDGTTNDTAAIQAAINAAFAYAQANASSYAEIYFPPSPSAYIVSSALSNTGLGNSQLYIPINADTARKVTLVFRGALDAAAMPHWNQTSGQRWGATLKTTLTGQSLSGTWGVPSILGGPAVTGSSSTYGVNNSSTFNNVAVILEGIGFAFPVNPTIGAVEFRALCQAVIRRCAAIPDAARTAISGTPPTNDWTFGFMLPQTTNNDRNVVEDVSVYGQYVGFKYGEHAWVNRTASIYCHDGVAIEAVLSGTHGIAMGSISVEGCVDAVRCYDSSVAPISIAMLSTESISNRHVNDPNNALYGDLKLNAITGVAAITTTGAGNLRILAANQIRGALTAPTMPATTVALVNPFWTDASVFIAASGATITSVSLDGVATGATSGWFPVRSGGSITLAYTGGPPTWKWWTH